MKNYLKPSLLTDWVLAHESEFTAIRHKLHRNPEPGHQEWETTALVQDRLRACGAELMENCFETGVAAWIYGQQPGPLIALREDIDALPIEEKTGLPFSSERPGFSHACGHDLHTAALLGCAEYLCAHTEQLHGSVLVVFQCAEETCDGAETMLGQGLFQKRLPDAVIGFHCAPSLPLGTVGIRRGISNASCDTVTVKVMGKGGHGAHPDECVDPVAAAAYLLAQLQTVISRESAAVEPSVLTFGTIHGGTAPNIIPDKVVMQGTLRTLDVAVREHHMAAIHRIGRHCCAGMGACAEVIFEKGMPPLVNTPALCDVVSGAAKKILGKNSIKEISEPSLGSDDFSCLLNACGGGVQFLMGTQDEAVEASGLGLHVAGNIFPDAVLAPAIAMLIQTALDGGRA